MKIYELAKFADTDDGTVEWAKSFTTFDEAKQASVKDKYPDVPDLEPVFIHLDDTEPEFWQWMEYEIQEVDVAGPHEVYVVLQNVSDFDPSEVPVAITSNLTAAKNYVVDQGVEVDDIKEITEQDFTTWDTCCHTEAEAYLGADAHSGEYRIITMAVLNA